MTEEELIINKRSGWTTGEDIVLSKINQIYYETREIETSGEESEGSGYKDFDISTLPAGAIRAVVYNLHGRSVGIAPTLYIGGSEPVYVEAKESFAFYEIEGEEPEHSGDFTYPIIHCTLEDVPAGAYSNTTPEPIRDPDDEEKITSFYTSLIVESVGEEDEREVVHSFDGVYDEQGTSIFNIETVPASELKTSGTLELRAAKQLSLVDYTITVDFSLSDQDLVSSISNQISEHETGIVSIDGVFSDDLKPYFTSSSSPEASLVNNLRLAESSDIISFSLML